MNYKVIVIIPALNPDEKLIKLVEELRDNNYDVIVINDGSISKCDIIFNKLKDAKVLYHDENLGKGASIKTGLKYVKNNNDDEYIIVTMDADGQHTVKDAKRLVIYVENNMDSLALGSRTLDKTAPLKSRIGNMITRNIFKLSTGVKIYDTQTGLRCFSNKMINKMISIDGNRYEYEINVLLKCAKDGTPIKEIDIKTIYIDNNKYSHFNALTDSFRIYKSIIKFSLSSIISFIIDIMFYSLFLILINNNKYSLILSNVFARVISSTFNYIFNKNVVFKYNGNIKKSLISYALLVIFILLLNTVILTIFVNIGLNKLIAKIITEVLLFIISFIIQNKIIFKI